jgi:hypothetical protein
MPLEDRPNHGLFNDPRSASPRLIVLAASNARVLLVILNRAKTEGAGNAGRESTPAASCAKIKKHTSFSHYRSGRIVRRFLRNGFNGFLRARPGDRLFDSHILELQSGSVFDAAEGFEA